MRYIFYADVYFLQNFMIKVTVIYLSLYGNKMNFEITRIRGLIKICLVAFFGTIFEIIGLVYVNSYALFLVLVHLLEMPLMFIAIVAKEKRKIIRLIFMGYFYVMLINGILEALWNQFGERGSYLFYLLFSCGAVIVGVRMWCNYKKIQKGVFQVQLMHQGKIVQLNGFYDSGNRLKDTYTQKGVHIISEKLLEKMWKETPVYIPYKSLGNDLGMLEVYYIDELIVEGEKQKIRIQNCPLGVTKDNLFEGKKYQIILNEEVF